MAADSPPLSPPLPSSSSSPYSSRSTSCVAAREATPSPASCCCCCCCGRNVDLALESMDQGLVSLVAGAAGEAATAGGGRVRSDGVRGAEAGAGAEAEAEGGTAHEACLCSGGVCRAWMPSCSSAIVSKPLHTGWEHSTNICSSVRFSASSRALHGDGAVTRIPRARSCVATASASEGVRPGQSACARQTQIAESAARASAAATLAAAATDAA